MGWARSQRSTPRWTTPLSRVVADPRTDTDRRPPQPRDNDVGSAEPARRRLATPPAAVPDIGAGAATTSGHVDDDRSDASAPAPVGRAAAAQGASAAPGPAAPNPHAELDELARRLYPSLRDRLKAELRLDRERAGRITDLQA